MGLCNREYATQVVLHLTLGLLTYIGGGSELVGHGNKARKGRVLACRALSWRLA